MKSMILDIQKLNDTRIRSLEGLETVPEPHQVNVPQCDRSLCSIAERK